MGTLLQRDSSNSYVVSNASIAYFENNDGVFTETTQVLPSLQNESYQELYPMLVDIDNDEDLDLFVGIMLQSRQTQMLLFENKGNRTAAEFIATHTNPLSHISVDSCCGFLGGYSRPISLFRGSFIDIDDDS